MPRPDERCNFWRLLAVAGSILSLAPIARAQTVAPFIIRAQQGSTSVTVASGVTLPVLAEAVNRQVTVTFSVTYRGGTTASIVRLDLAGTNEFTLSGVSGLPIRLEPNGETRFEARFTPTSSRAAQAQLSLAFTEGTPPGPVGVVLVNLQGVAPELTVAYQLQAVGNVIPVPNGGTVLFSATPVGTTAIAQLIIVNRGSGALELRTITASGPEFQVLGIPLLPGFLGAGLEVRLTVRYTPAQSGIHSGSIDITASERSFTARLEGSATGPSFTYELLDPSTSVPLRPNEQFSLPDTPLGNVLSLVVQVRNGGDGDGPITAIGVLGPGFTLTDVPFLPQTLTPGGVLFFTLNFAPTQPGRAVGRLRIGNANFEFLANALGARLVYSFTSAGADIPVAPNGTVSFPPTAVGARSSLGFSIANSGTTDAVITSIVTLAGTEFAVGGFGALPLALAPGGRIALTIVFTPNTTGATTAALRVDTQPFNLSGFGTPPPSLPAYRLDGAAGVVDPLQQLAVSLALAASYPINIAGTLNLSFTSASFAVDPALQFVTGGRSVNFTIPAGATNAIFPNSSSQIRLQTGTVGGTIVLQPNFTTATGFNLTPSTAPGLNLTVPARIPGLLALEVGSTPTGFSVFITGYATGRTLTRINLVVTPKANARLTGDQIALEVASTAAVWYRSSTSLNFGSLFTATIPITVRGLSTTGLPTDFIDSVSATLTNELGTSSALSQPLR